MSGAKHSPLPWYCDGEFIVDAKSEAVADLGYLSFINVSVEDGQVVLPSGPLEQTTNAAFIIEACNSHAPLGEALEACVHALREIGEGRASTASALAFLASGQADVSALSKGEA